MTYLFGIGLVSMETKTESEFNTLVWRSVQLVDMIGEDRVLQLGLSVSQLLTKYNVQLELWKPND